MAGTGRKSKYDEFIRPHLARIEHLCRMGATEEEICRKFSVSVSAFNVYKNQHPELVEALKRGKVDADDAVEAALFRRATGYSYEEVRTNSYADNAENQRQFRTVVTREVPRTSPPPSSGSRTAAPNAGATVTNSESKAATSRSNSSKRRKNL
ncbi:MAG: hypothetical protein L6W00_12125 [Lentisphaeria bacterium]|nr:MAG: hypothetical protein L6W00_12125 [Lentisphaeria bacterium]